MEAESPFTAQAEEEEPWKREFVMAWVELMTKQFKTYNDVAELAKQVAKPGETAAVPAAVQEAVAGLRELTEVGEQLRLKVDDYLSMDLIPALRRAEKNQPKRQARPKDAPPERCEHCGLLPGQRGVKRAMLPKDSLDSYLANGDSCGSLPPDFVAHVSSWGEQHKGTSANQLERRQEIPAWRNSERGGGQDTASDEELASRESESWTMEQFHDSMVANTVRLAAEQVPDFPVQSMPWYEAELQQWSEAAAANVPAVMTPPGFQATPKKKQKIKRRSPPPPIVCPPQSRSSRHAPTSISPLSNTNSNSSDASQSRRRLGPNRIGKREAANLIATEILDIRKYGSQYEYQIRWENRRSPTWIAARKCPEQARELIEEYQRKYRPRGRARAMGTLRVEAAWNTKKEAKAKQKKPESKMSRGTHKKSKKAASVTSASAGSGSGSDRRTEVGKVAATESQLFIVDRIVGHRLVNHKKQYLVRWDGYESSEDTWENAGKLRVDVPDVVNAYEEQRRMKQKENPKQVKSSGRAETASKTKGAPKRSVAADKHNETEKKRPPLEMSLRITKERRAEAREEERCAEKKTAKDEEDVGGDVEDAEELEAYFENEVEGVDSGESDDSDDSDESDESDDSVDAKDEDFDVEEAELEEYSEDEFMDDINA